MNQNRFFSDYVNETFGKDAYRGDSFNLHLNFKKKKHLIDFLLVVHGNDG